MDQSISIPSGIGLPSQRELDQWQAECDRIDEQMAALARRKRGFEALIAAARQLLVDFGVPSMGSEAGVGDGSEAAPTAAPPVPAAAPVSWAHVRAEVLGRLPPATGSRLRSTTGKSDEGAANRPRLVERARILPYKGQLFSPVPPPQPAPPPAAQATAEATPQMPEAPPPVAVPVAAAPPPPAPAMPPRVGDVILSFLDRVTVGAPSAVIIAELRKWPHLAGWVEANKAQVLNLLSRLVDEGDVLKGGGVYYRNRQRPSRIDAAE